MGLKDKLANKLQQQIDKIDANEENLKKEKGEARQKIKQDWSDIKQGLSRSKQSFKEVGSAKDDLLSNIKQDFKGRPEEAKGQSADKQLHNICIQAVRDLFESYKKLSIVISAYNEDPQRIDQAEITHQADDIYNSSIKIQNSLIKIQTEDDKYTPMNEVLLPYFLEISRSSDVIRNSQTLENLDIAGTTQLSALLKPIKAYFEDI